MKDNKENLPIIRIPSDSFDVDNDIITKVKKEESTYNKDIANKYGIK